MDTPLTDEVISQILTQMGDIKNNNEKSQKNHKTKKNKKNVQVDMPIFTLASQKNHKKSQKNHKTIKNKKKLTCQYSHWLHIW